MTAPIDDVVMSLGSNAAAAKVRLTDHFDGGGAPLEYTVSSLRDWVSTAVDADGMLEIRRASSVPQGFVRAIDQLVVRATSRTDPGDYRELGFDVIQATPVRVGNAFLGNSSQGVMAIGTALDLAAAPRLKRPVEVPRPQVPGPLTRRVGDFNGDHADDVAWLDARGRVWVTLTRSGTQFSPVTRWGSLPQGPQWRSITVADFTGDGRSDLAAQNAVTGNWRVLVSNGDRFTGPALFGTMPPRTAGQDVVAGDFDGNGTADLAVRHAGTGKVWVSRSIGNRFVSGVYGQFATGFSESLTVGDFNGDGRSDIAARHAGSGEWGVLVSEGARLARQKVFGTWSAAVRWRDLIVGDFDADGLTDLAARAPQTGQWIVSRSHGGTFETSLFSGFGSPTPDLVFSAGDFDFDGKTDIVARNSKTGVWRMLGSTGSGFTAPRTIGRLPASARWMDMAPIRIDYMTTGQVAGPPSLPSGTLVSISPFAGLTLGGGVVASPPSSSSSPPSSTLSGEFTGTIGQTIGNGTLFTSPPAEPVYLLGTTTPGGSPT